MGKERSFSELYQLKKIIYSAAEEMASEVLWQIENKYETIIDEFYADYNPLYYNRTYSTYLGSSGYETLYSPQNFTPIPSGYRVGIEVDSKYYPNNPYRAEDVDWVFERTWEKGIHGINTKRWGGVKTKKYQKVSGRKIFEVIYRKNSTVTKKRKLYEGNVRFQNRFMSNMIPAPRALMNDWWRKYTTKHNLDKIWSNALNNKLG